MIRSVVGWIVARKPYLVPLLLLSSAVLLIVGWYCNPAPESAIFVTTFHADYVGELEGRLRARGIGGGTMGLGYGMAAGSRYARFSKVLNLSEEDIAKIRASGAPYEIGVHDRAIITVSGQRGAVIDYGEYVARATWLRNLLFLAGVAAFVLAIAIQLARGRG